MIHTGVVPSTIVRTRRGGGDRDRRHDAARRGCGRDGRACRRVRATTLRRRVGAVTAGSGVSFAGTDITAGETVLRRGQILTSRDTGVLAAIGVAAVDVWRRPIVAILSTGDEIIAPGEPMQPARIYDSNAQVLADAVREAGRRAAPPRHRAGRRRRAARETARGAGRRRHRAALGRHEQGRRRHLLSRRRRADRSRHRRARRGAQAGQADLPRGHGGRPVVVLPGFPTSAIFTFHEFVAPVLSAMAGRTSRRARRRCRRSSRCA